MILEKIDFYNFKPYIGDQSADLSPGKNAPLILIFGENNRGKSSLFDAIYWALYGKLRDRVSRDYLIPDSQLMNDVAWKSGENSFQVTVYFSHNGNNYVLSRRCELSRLQDNGRGKAKQTTYLKKNNDFVANEEIESAIGEILNEKISIFFLCDMEVLSEYEKLVRDDSAASVEVKQAIENISVRDALRSIESDAFKEIKKIENLNSKAEEIKNKIIEEEKRYKEYKSEDQKIVKHLNEKKAELSNLNKALEQYEVVADFIREEQELVRKTEAEQKEMENLRAELQQAIKESWWLPISDFAEGKFQETQEATSTAARRQEKLSDKKGRLGRLIETKATGNCSECKQPLDKTSFGGLEKEINELNSEIEVLSKPLIPSIESLVEESKRLSQFRVPSKAALIAANEKRIRKIRNDISSRNQIIQDLKKRIGEVNREQISKD
jgi:DNA sulfur modification protein DndD